MSAPNHPARLSGNREVQESRLGIQTRRKRSSDLVAQELPGISSAVFWRRVWSEPLIAIAELPIGHFLGHIQNELAIALFRLAQQAAKLVEKAGFFADAPPGDIVRGLALGKVRQLWRLFTVIEQLIEWHFERPGQLLQCFNRGNGMAILHARNVTPKQAGTLLDV